MLSLEPTDNGQQCPNCGAQITAIENSVNPQCPNCGVYLNKIAKREVLNAQQKDSCTTVGVKPAGIPVSENPAIKYMVGLAIVIATVFGIKYAFQDLRNSPDSFVGIALSDDQLESSKYGGTILEIDYVAQSDKLELYVFSWCGWSKKAREDLKKRNIEFVEYDLEESKHGKEVYSKLVKINHRKAPVFVVGDKVFRAGGYPQQVLKALEEQKLK